MCWILNMNGRDFVSVFLIHGLSLVGGHSSSGVQGRTGYGHVSVQGSAAYSGAAPGVYCRLAHTLNWIFWAPLAKASAVHCILIAVENATVFIHIWPIGFNLKKMIVGRRGAGIVAQKFPSGKLLRNRVRQSAVVERVSHSCQAERCCCKAERCCRFPQLASGVLLSYRTAVRRSAVVVSHSCQAECCCPIPQLSGGALLSYHYIVRRCAAVVRYYST